MTEPARMTEPTRMTEPGPLSEDAKTVLLKALREALDELAEARDWDAILFVVTLMRRVHDAS